jgi:hypothetical protein
MAGEVGGEGDIESGYPPTVVRSIWTGGECNESGGKTAGTRRKEEIVARSFLTGLLTGI